MPIKTCCNLSYNIRHKSEKRFAYLKRECKREIQLTSKPYSMFFIWHTKFAFDATNKLYNTSVVEYRKCIEENLLLLTEEQANSYPENVWLYRIYEPYASSFHEWTNPKAVRLAKIDEALRDINKNDTRNFGEKMRDLKTKHNKL